MKEYALVALQIACLCAFVWLAYAQYRLRKILKELDKASSMFPIYKGGITWVDHDTQEKKDGK